MGIPRAVAEQARKIEEQYFGNTEAKPEAASEAPAEETTDQPETENDAPEQIEANEATAESIETTEPEAQPEPSDDGNWEHKFKVLQGKYNAEVKKVRDENKALKGEVQSLQAQLARTNDLLTRLADRPADRPAEQPANTPQKSPRDALLELARRYDDGEITMSEYEAQRADLQEQIDNERLSRVQQETEAKTRAMTAEQRFWSDLSAQVPDWQTVNDDPAFHAWLAEEEGLTGMSRQQVLEAAQQRMDSAQVVRVFNAFKQASQPATNPNRAALEKQVAPGKSKAAPRQPQPQGFDPRKLEALTQQAIRTRDPEQKRRLEQQINDLIASASAA